VAVAQKPADHVPAHPTEADHCQLHLSSPLSPLGTIRKATSHEGLEKILGVIGAPVASAGAALRNTLANDALRRIEGAWAAGIAADGAFLVVLLVVAYDAGGAVAVGILGAVRVVPAIFATPHAMALVERYRGHRVLTVINVLRALGAVATALVIAVDLPLAVTFVLAALVAGAGSLVRPIQTALLPALARTPAELVAANVASSTGEGIGTFIGPLLAGVLVVSTGSVPASVLVAAGFAAAAALLTGVRFERETDARGGIDEAHSSRFRLADISRMVRLYPGASLVVADFLAQVLVRGLLVTLIVVASIELLGMGDGGVGLLNAVFGLGGLAGALAALGLVGARGLTAVFALALVGWGAPLALVGAAPTPVIALGALFVSGVSNAALDVSGFTLIQRGVRNEDRVTMFALFESGIGLGLLVGSLLAPLLVSTLGIRAALIATGAVLPVVAALTLRPIAKHTRTGALTEEISALLRGNPLFAPLPLTALDRVAESLVPCSFGPGDVVMRKGELGDHYLLIAVGSVDVADETRLLRTCGAGDGVGEIALLRSVPHTANVVACSHVDGYAIDSATFLSAIAGPAATAAAESVASARLAHSGIDGPQASD
jgi:Cyclic nucleotide-binding domain/Major Facilitator Superfamily